MDDGAKAYPIFSRIRGWRRCQRYEFCDDIAERFHKIILRMDWDEKGESLNRNVSGHLKGMWEEFSPADM